MLYTRGSKKLKALALAVALVSLPLLASSAIAQVVPEKPVRGTIQVHEGDDYQALAKITLEQARDAALAEVPGATFADGELDDEDGYLVYDIDLTQEGKEVEVVVDAGDGSVLEVEQEDEVDDD